MSRLFVAVVPPEEVLDQIASLDRPEERGVRYTRRPQWHVTLRFLGEADEPRAVAAVSSVEWPAAEVVLGPELRGLGRRVVVVPADGLAGLAAAVADATAELADSTDPRPFHGHLTIARLKKRGAGRVVGQPFSARFLADRIHLIRSTLDPAGARYRTLAARSLA